MPIIESNYKPGFWHRNGFVATVYSGLIRRINGLQQTRERIRLSDDDFLDLDWSYANQKTDQLIVLLHGLEGNGQRPYITGAAKYFNANGIDTVAVNFRSCSGEDNLKYRTYHSGATEDLHDVINHIITTKDYTRIYIKGISLGANLALKYVGEGISIPKQIKAIIAISVPCDLSGSCIELHKFKNKAYVINFLAHLKKKLILKVEKYPDQISKRDFKAIKDLKDFDDIYTSKAHGFKNAEDYYAKASCLQFLPNVKVPSLIINALNDSFLSASCYPVKEAKINPNIHLEMPKYGGHVGFITRDGVYYNEVRALDFIESIIK